MSRWQRIMHRLAGRRADYQGLRTAGSVDQALAWAQRTPLDMFNKNVLRAKVVQGLVEALPCNRFYEMGTYHAATTIGAQRYLNLPVWSCEINPRNYRISRLVTLGLPHITLVNADSRHFLRQSCAELQRTPDARPFFYLDAHEDESDLDTLPLAEELELVLALDEFVILIDDFQVPGLDAYAPGTFGGVVLTIDLIAPALLARGITTCYFPGYAPAQDTGYPSGYCVFGRSDRLEAQLRRPTFPLDLLRPYAIEPRAYRAPSPAA